jgi:nitrous oxide reductase accessory protein NosL
MPDFLPKSPTFWIRTLLAGLALVILVAGTVHCDKKDESTTSDKLDQQVQSIKNQYSQVATCGMCRKEATGKTVCRLSVDPGVKVKTCCARCGTSMLKRMGHQKAGETICYATGQRIDLREATYVVGSDTKICCGPSVLAFYSREEAEKFVEKHHGEIKRFKDL